AGAGDERPDSLRSWCRERMRDYEYPHLIRFVDELPQTLTGKPQRFRLREMIESELTPAGTDGSPQRGARGPDGEPVASGTTQTPTATRMSRTARPASSAGQAITERPPPYLAQQLAELPDTQRDDAVMAALLSEMSKVMGEPSPERIEVGRSFKELGFDSLAAVELRNRLGNAAGA